MKHQSRFAVGALLVATSLACSGGTSWREVWHIDLSMSLETCTLLTKFANRSDNDLLGLNNILTISRNNSFYGYAFDPTLRPLPVELPSRTGLERLSILRELDVVDGRGTPISTETLVRDLQIGDWTIGASVTDKGTKKPSTESSYLVFSNSIELDEAQVSKCLSGELTPQVQHS